MSEGEGYPAWLLEAVGDVGPGSTVVVDADGECVWTNERARRLTGVEPGDRDPFGGRAVYDEAGEPLAPDERPHAVALATGTAVEGRELQVDHDGERRWIEVDAAPVERGGSVAAVVVQTVDVTERRERELELERYRRLTETTTDGVVVVDPDGEFSLVNEAFADLVGCEREALLGTPVSDVLDRAAMERVRWAERELRTTDRDVGRIEFSVGGADPTPVEATFSVSEGLDGGTSRVAVVRDVTERKRFERRLQELYEFTQSLFDATTEDEVTDQVVSALRGILGLPNVVVYEYDAEDAALVPVAASSEGEGIPAPMPPLPVAESITGTVFSRGEGEVFESIKDQPQCHVSGHAGGIEGAVMVPIGGRGAILVGSTRRGAFDDRTRRLMEVVSANAEAAYARVDREREIRSQRRRLVALSDLNSLAQGIAEAVVHQSSREDVEALACERLADSDSYEFAWVGSADRETGDLRVHARAATDGYLEDLPPELEASAADRGPAATAQRTREIQVVQDVTTSDRFEPWGDRAKAHGARSAASIPIAFQDEVYGVLNVYSGRTDGFGAAELETLERLGPILGHAVRSVEQERELAESEARYRTLAENLPGGVVTLVDADRRVRTVAGGAIADLPVDADGLEGRPVAVLRSVAADAVDAVGAALDGESVRTEVRGHGRVYDVQAIPLREDRSGAAAMALFHDITERIRREREIEAERARLEFLNRLIRHNLLNSLNVVEARLDLVGEDVSGDAGTHLDIAQSRTAEMIDLVETIRSLMAAISGEGDEDLEAVDVGAVVADEVRLADETFDDAVFVLRDEESVPVRANALLEEVFENLLANAVQHNDKPVPRVEVSIEDRADAVTVRVADNGPGVPEDLQAEIFGKGTKSFDSPGTGFGLHLSREIVEAYGGDVSVADRDGGGAVFEVTLPRADAA